MFHIVFVQIWIDITVFHLILIHVFFHLTQEHKSMQYHLKMKFYSHFVWQQTIFTCEWIVSVLSSHQFGVLLLNWMHFKMVEFRSNPWILLKFRHVIILKQLESRHICTLKFTPFSSFQFQFMVDFIKTNSANFLWLN